MYAILMYNIVYTCNVIVGNVYMGHAYLLGYFWTSQYLILNKSLRIFFH